MPTPVIAANNLVKKCKDIAAVDGISFEVDPRESFGLLGPNGAGKSTTMRMVGAVSTRTPQLGVVPQSDNLDIELRVRDNLIAY